ncbi:3' exoribonuclease family 1 containing protein (macronuclear) [Tetrahymena thermophila SB210]|uniref:3' exoribonuclease family 1 containing protein n=1 Tax=Tetrahymena thermophila (strain SB210) TaxID=312017 RepID=I7MN22_TETTS|nr:3' exoribonuclease family 1 containing protein [Tetrahymena thermophila SB210]EAS07759.2 3' exoribonuclease family 1 containing protein [Tetrahymena thermophila SB210]|eukprot:XP_001028001.2 3' exoribonuclease family 1 containing protein [Tetrahymena thermophila SB210]
MEEEKEKDSQQTIVNYKQKTIKKKKKKLQQAGWIPLIQNILLNFSNEPVYIPFYKKIMKRYDDENYNKYRNYGFTDSGFCSIDQIKLDYIHENLQISMNTHSIGNRDFSFLIEMYKSYQDQQYYELAILLEKYQIKCQQQISKLEQVIDELNQMKYITQEELSESFDMFEKDVMDWVNQNIQNEIYELSLGFINFESKIPDIKKKIFSKNIIEFLARDIQTFFSQLSQKNMKIELDNLMNGQEFSGRIQLEKKINTFKQILSDQKYIETEDEVITIEGLVLPAKRKSKMLFYNHRNRQITKEQNLMFFIIRTYDFDASQIQRLINLRNELLSNFFKNNKHPNFQNSSFQGNIFQNFEYACQQEYFLEKFKYI